MQHLISVMRSEFYQQGPLDFYRHTSLDWMRLHSTPVPYRVVELPKFQELLDSAFQDAHLLLKRAFRSPFWKRRWLDFEALKQLKGLALLAKDRDAEVQAAAVSSLASLNEAGERGSSRAVWKQI